MHAFFTLILLASICTTSLPQQCARTLPATQPTLQYKVIEGDIFLVRNNPVYRGYASYANLQNVVDSTGKPLAIEPTELLMQVWATSEDCSDWESHKHPLFRKFAFPEHLPLFLLQDKQEGDTIQFFFKDQETCDSTLFLIKLRCAQLSHRYDNSGPFEKTVNSLVTGFSQYGPFCRNERDEQKLLHAGITKEPANYRTDRLNDRFLHGPYAHSSVYDAQRDHATRQQRQDVAQATGVARKYTIVSGDIYLIGNSASYRGHCKNSIHNIVDEYGYEIPIKPQDVLVHTCVISDKQGKYDWDAWGIPGSSDRFFPTELPLFLLEGKQEGDTIAFFIKNPRTEEIYDVRLTCKQYRYGMSFHRVLRMIMSRFMQNPSYHIDTLNLKLLEEQQILQPIKTEELELETTEPQLFTSAQKYTHGSAGYRWDMYVHDERRRELEDDHYLVQEEDAGDLHIAQITN